VSRDKEYCEGCQSEMSDNDVDIISVDEITVCSELCLRVVEDYEEWDEICR